MYDIWLHTIAFVENQLIYFFADLPLFLRSSTVEHPTLDLEVLIIVDFVRPRGQNFFSFFNKKYDVCCPLVAKISIIDVSELM